MTERASMSLQWIKDHLDYPHEYCLIWPFGRDKVSGRGSLQFEGRSQYAHRVMCRLAKGEPPTPEHEAAHSCGNGHLACVNPNHLGWKTVSENHLDTSQHGRRSYGERVLNDEMVAEIRALQGKEKQKDVAARYGVSAPTISHIWYGRTHTAVKQMNYFTAEEDRQILALAAEGKNFTQIGRVLGRLGSSVGLRAKKLGAPMNYKPWSKGTKTTELPRT